MSSAPNLADQVSISVLACAVPRDAVDDAVRAAGRQARRRNGKLPPHLVVYLVMALALFAEESYEEVAAKLTGSLAAWHRRGGPASLPTSGGITQARQRLGPEPLELLFRKVATPVASSLTRGAHLRGWRLMAVDGFELAVPDTPANVAVFRPSAGPGEQGFPLVRVVVIGECGSQAKVDAQFGPADGRGDGRGGWPQLLAQSMYRRLDPGWLLLADRDFCSWTTWQAAAATGAALLWRAAPDLDLPVLGLLPDGSFVSVLTDPCLAGLERDVIIETARGRGELGQASAALVRVIEYERADPALSPEAELIALVTTITDPAQASAWELAVAYQGQCADRTTGGSLSSLFRLPGAVLRSRSPDLIRQEVFGYLLTHYVLSVLSFRAATSLGAGQDLTAAVRIVRRSPG